MRRMFLGATVGLLLATTVAFAHGFDGKAVKQVSATFTATAATDLRTSTCTGADGSYAKSRATYSGSAASAEPSLNGPARIEAASFVNTTTGVGTVWGVVRISTADGHHTSAAFEGVLANGSVVGLAEGRNHPGRDGAKLLAAFSADYSAAGGFANGKLGGGTASGGAVLITRGGCEPPKPPKPEQVKARGSITAVSPSAITVAGVTCAVPAALQNAIAKVKVGDRVTIRCEVANGASTLVHVSRHGHGT